MLLMSMMVLNVLSDLGVKRSTPKLNYYLVLDFLIIERGEGVVMRWKSVPTCWKVG